MIENQDLATLKVSASRCPTLRPFISAKGNVCLKDVYPLPQAQQARDFIELAARHVSPLIATVEALRAENVALHRALDDAEEIRDNLVANADMIGDLIFQENTPDENGNDRYSASTFAGLTFERAEEVAGLINECMDTDWVHTDGIQPYPGMETDEHEAHPLPIAVNVTTWAREALGMLDAAGTPDDLLTWMIRARDLAERAPAVLRVADPAAAREALAGLVLAA